MRASVETITPRMAQVYLECNVNNYRKIDERKSALYAKDIAAGRWELNGESIKFNRKGELVDGQHRLDAIVKADTPADMLVIRDVDNGVRLFDNGKNRTVREILLANGISSKICDNVYAGASAIIVSGDPDGSTYRGGKYPTKKEIVSEIEDNITIWEAVSRIVQVSNGKGKSVMRKSCVYAAIYFLLKWDEREEDLADFFGVVKTGFPLNNTDCSAAIVLRNMLLGFNSKSDRNRFFSATIDAYFDFKNGVTRSRQYTVNKSNILMLKAMAETREE